MSHPVIDPQRQRITALWPVLTSRPTEGRRLSYKCGRGPWFLVPLSFTFRCLSLCPSIDVLQNTVVYVGPVDLWGPLWLKTRSEHS